MSGFLNVLVAGGGFTPVLVSYTTAGTFTETIPGGATTAVIEVFGHSGSGGLGQTGCTVQGGGAGSGSYAKTTFNVSAQNGKTWDLVLRAAAAGTGLTTTFNAGATNGVTGFTNITAPGGGNGGNGSSGGNAGAAALTASGGTDLNQTGNAGIAGSTCGGGAGGAGRTGTNGNGGAGGNGGQGAGSAGRGLGVDARVYISYT